MSKRKGTDSLKRTPRRKPVKLDPVAEPTSEERELNEMLATLEKERAELEALLKTAEGDTTKKITALQQSFRDRAKAERERFLKTTDSEYHLTLCFQTRAQKEAFLVLMRWAQIPLLGDKHIDGLAVADFEGIALPQEQLQFVPAKPDKRLNEISQPL